MRLPIAREGLPFIAIMAAVTIAAFVFADLLASGGWWGMSLQILKFLLMLLTVFVVAFFRDPERVVPADPASIVSPADGKVIKIETVNDTRFLNANVTKISIFMNLFSVHVNRAPADIKVLKVIYNPGKFFNASFDKASLENEQNAVIAEGPTGRRFCFNQIAGLVARRIVCYASEGSRYSRGERFGMIRFGSRLDVYLPTDARVSVKLGDHVSAGSSVLAYWA
jgi:phosphatidylserine decarboxylase